MDGKWAAARAQVQALSTDDLIGRARRDAQWFGQEKATEMTPMATNHWFAEASMVLAELANRVHAEGTR